MTADDTRQTTIRRMRFRPDEDIILTHLVCRYGLDSWRRVAAAMPGRNYRQCRDRWNHYLSKPKPPNPTVTGWQPLPTVVTEAPDVDNAKRKRKPDAIGPDWKQTDLFQFPSEGEGPFDAFSKGIHEYLCRV